MPVPAPNPGVDWTASVMGYAREQPATTQGAALCNPCIQSVCWTQHHDRSQSPKRATVELRNPIQPEATFLASSDYAQITLADSKEICHVSAERFSHPHHQRKISHGRPLNAKTIDESAALWRTFRGAADVFCYHLPSQTRLQKGSAHLEHVPEILTDDERCAKYA